uniref:Uncharacterized protein n=1 Tax=Cacopsylla melanoneura TaxID=428564 RepID=A0A8D8S5Y6_9HEMI
MYIPLWSKNFVPWASHKYSFNWLVYIKLLKKKKKSFKKKVSKFYSGQIHSQMRRPVLLPQLQPLNTNQDCSNMFINTTQICSSVFINNTNQNCSNVFFMNTTQIAQINS